MNGKIILRLSILPAALLLAVMMVATAEAREGFYLGAEMVFVNIGGAVNSGDTISAGDGAGVTAGYGIGRYVSLEASLQKTAHEVSDGRQIDLAAGMIGAKVLVPLADSHLEPYLVLGLGTYVLDTRRGDGWMCGAGMDIRLSPSFSLTLGIALHYFDLDHAPRISGDLTSMNIGIAYRFL